MLPSNAYSHLRRLVEKIIALYKKRRGGPRCHPVSLSTLPLVTAYAYQASQQGLRLLARSESGRPPVSPTSGAAAVNAGRNAPQTNSARRSARPKTTVANRPAANKDGAAIHRPVFRPLAAIVLVTKAIVAGTGRRRNEPIARTASVAARPLAAQNAPERLRTPNGLPD